MTEYANMIRVLNESGIKFSIHHAPGHETGLGPLIRQNIKSCGFNLTPLATTAIVFQGGLYYVYSTGKPHWTSYKDDAKDFDGHKGWGDDGMFLFSMNSNTGHFEPRVVMNSDSLKVIASGLDAIKYSHGPIPDFTPRG